MEENEEKERKQPTSVFMNALANTDHELSSFFADDFQ